MSGVAPQLAVVVGATLGILALIWAIGRIGPRFGWRPELQRKAIHVATGLFAIALPFLVQDRWPVILLIAAGLVVMGLMRLPALAGGFGSALHGVQRKSYGELLLALAVGFIYLRAQGNLILYTLPVAVITLSDTAAALAGTAYGRRIFQIERGTKSIEGVVMFFMVTLIVTMAMLLLFTDVSRLNVLLLGVTVAAFGALVEMDSWRGLDNLFVPVAIHFYLEGSLHAPEAQVLGLAAAFLAALVLIGLLGPSFRILTPHAARAFCVAAFLLIGISGALAAVLPIVAVAAHCWARTRRPCRSPFPELDLLATLSGMALIWLIVGESIGPSAINFFEMTIAGIVIVYVALASGQRLLWVAPAGLALLAAYGALVLHSRDEVRWHGSLLAYAGATLAACAFAAMLRPAWFDRWRAPRVAILASLIPLTTYLWLAI